jgi:hypothetical protein
MVQRETVSGIMKHMKTLLSFFLSVALPSSLLISKSIDATKNPAWINKQWNLVGEDTLRGFVHLKNGLSITGKAARVVFDTCGTIDGSLKTRAIDTLKLEHDLILGSHAYFAGSAKIDGGGHTVRMSSNVEIPLEKSLVIVGDTTLDGQGCTLIVPSAHALVVGENAKLTLKNIQVHILCNDALSMKSDSSSLVLENATITLKAHYAIQRGSVDVHNDVVVRGPYEFQYKSNRPLTINSCSMLYLDHDVIFRYEHENRSLVHMADASSILYCNGCSLKIVADDVQHSGLQLTRGTLYFENKVVIENKNSDGTRVNQDPLKSFEWGNGNPDNDLDVKLLAGARVEIEGHLFDNPSI